ncbi:hypothetical protein PWT90_05882 [Aphanocladium album]|nr:hypothetical protein PWT90_05882 [Aphanocladium album]
MGKLEKEKEALAEHAAAGQEDHDLPPEYCDDGTVDAPPPGYTPGPSPYRKVPVGWNVYYKAWSMRTYQVGPHADQPVFSLELHSGLLSSRPFLVLFDGPDKKQAPQIATAKRDGLIKGHALITVPGRPGSVEPITERLTVHTTRMNFSFNVGAGTGKETRREDFEWRFSHGKEVRALDRWATGWKLVHLGGNDGTGSALSNTESGGSSSSNSRSQRPHGESSDGRPIVAVFADNSRVSRTKLARFHFVGAGATDEFGEEWAMYVTMTALRIWEMMMNTTSASWISTTPGAAITTS